MFRYTVFGGVAVASVALSVAISYFFLKGEEKKEDGATSKKIADAVAAQAAKTSDEIRLASDKLWQAAATGAKAPAAAGVVLAKASYPPVRVAAKQVRSGERRKSLFLNGPRLRAPAARPPCCFVSSANFKWIESFLQLRAAA